MEGIEEERERVGGRYGESGRDRRRKSGRDRGETNDMGTTRNELQEIGGF